MYKRIRNMYKKAVEANLRRLISIEEHSCHGMAYIQYLCDMREEKKDAA